MIPRAAVAVIERRAPVPAVLLIRRAQRADDPWSGQWALPGGRSQANDVDLLATAVRETAEEIGLTLNRQQWTALPITAAGGHRGTPVPVAPFHRLLDVVPHELVADPREIAGIRWLDLAQLTDTSLRRTGPLPGGGDHHWEHLLVDGHPLWGFTWRVLTGRYG
jgi:8-oxo-dGTP pyrophosphatase MutT (NUDIX family)